MKALIYKKPGVTAVKNVPIPKLGKGYALVRVAYAGVCGSDKFIVSGKHPRAKKGLILGHEFYGTIEKINGKGFRKGDGVVCYPLISCGKCLPCKTKKEYVCKDLKLYGIDKAGGMAEYVVVETGNLMKLPGRLKDPVPALIEPLAFAIHSVKMSKFKKGMSAIVLGGGPIGTLIAFVLKKKGASKVTIIQRSEYRMKIARKLGLSVINTKKKTEQADIVYECSSSQSGVDRMTELVKTSGQVVICSLHKEIRKVDLLKVVFDEIDVLGVRVYTKKDFKETIKFARKNQKELGKIVSHMLKLDNAVKIFNKPSKKDMKILINCK